VYKILPYNPKRLLGKWQITLEDTFLPHPVMLHCIWCLASLLLDSLLSYLTSGEQNDCKAVYLHVLTTNTTAIHFYERRNFRVHCCLPYYYSINGCPHDGYSYVLYINGGQPSSPLLYPLETAYFILLII